MVSRLFVGFVHAIYIQRIRRNVLEYIVHLPPLYQIIKGAPELQLHSCLTTLAQRADIQYPWEQEDLRWVVE